MSERPSRLLGVSLVVGLVAAALAYWAAHRDPSFVSDFDQIVVAARALRDGLNPYEHIGPGRPWRSTFNLYYPGPAIVVGLPFSFLSIPAARAAFAGLGMAVFAFGLLRCRPHCWPALLSFPALAAVWLVQWAPWIAAAMWLPALGAFAAAKPNVGFASLAGQRDVRSFAVSVTGAIGITALSLVLLPSWPTDWWHATRQAEHVQPLAFRVVVALPLLLAAMRWREPPARVLLAFALIPMTPGAPEGLLLAGAAETRKQALVLALLSHGMIPINEMARRLPTFVEVTDHLAWGIAAFVYLPVLVVLLLRRRAPIDGTTKHPSHW